MRAMKRLHHSCCTSLMVPIAHLNAVAPWADDATTGRTRRVASSATRRGRRVTLERLVRAVAEGRRGRSLAAAEEDGLVLVLREDHRLDPGLARGVRAVAE